MKIETLKDLIAHITEPRRTNFGNIRHKLEDIIIIGLCTVICGGDDFIEMEDFGRTREEWLKQFLELPNGIPDSDTFRRVFERLNPKELSQCLVNWLDVEHRKRSVVAVDGKTICGSANAEHKAFHVVSAFVTDNQITLGEIAVPDKTNEITAIPELLDLVDIKDQIVTIDAAGCQKKIAEKIVMKKADYVLALKDNQPELHKNVRMYFDSFRNEMESEETLDKGHGRMERREYRLLTDISWLEGRKEWKGLKAVGEAKSTVYEKDAVCEHTRYFITTLTDVKEFGNAVRSHWAIENNLHWSLDVIFREDAARARKDNSPLCMNVLRKTALSLLNNARYGRMSKKRIRFMAAMTPELMLNVLFGIKR